jgi:hypothetical protein
MQPHCAGCLLPLCSYEMCMGGLNVYCAEGCIRRRACAEVAGMLIRAKAGASRAWRYFKDC